MEQSISSSVTLQYNVKNQAFVNRLQTSAKVFSAFKTHHQSQALAALLVDPQGNTVPFAHFKKEALKVTGKYNTVWLKTEYNTALRRGRIGARFQKFREDEHLYPNLRWLPSTAAEPRSSHIRFYGLVLPITDPFWVNQFPGNAWNCKCDVEQTKAQADPAPQSAPKPPEGLEGNPAFTGQLIGKRHPYFKGLTGAEQEQVASIVQKETNKQVNAWAKKAIDADKGLSVASKTLQTGELLLQQKDVQRIVKQQQDAFVKTYITVLADDLPNLSYLGFEKATPNLFTYYRTRYGDQKLFVKMKVVGQTEQPYSVDTSLDTSVIIRENIPNS